MQTLERDRLINDYLDYTGALAAGLMLSEFSKWLRDLPIDRDLTLNLLSAELTVA